MLGVLKRFSGVIVVTIFAVAALGAAPGGGVDRGDLQNQGAAPDVTTLRLVGQRTARGENVRWSGPFCPVVMGLPKEFGDFVVRSLDDVARIENLAVPNGMCAGNPVIVVTARASSFSTAALVFRTNELSHSRIHLSRDEMVAFADKQSVGRTYILPEEKNALGVILNAINRDGVEEACRLAKVAVAGDVASNNESLSRCGQMVPAPSRWGALIVVDEKRIGGMPIGVLADYLAMMSLAFWADDSNLDRYDSIVTLVDSGAWRDKENVTITKWDRGYLDVLYKGEALTVK